MKESKFVAFVQIEIGSNHIFIFFLLGFSVLMTTCVAWSGFFPLPRTNYRQVCSHSNYNGINNNALDDPRQHVLSSACALAGVEFKMP